MLIGTLSIGKRFNPSIIMLKDLNINIEDEVLWKFAANSTVNLKYKLEYLQKENDKSKELGLNNSIPNNIGKETPLLTTLTKPFSGYDSKEIKQESELKGSYIKDKINTIEKTIKKAHSSNMKIPITNTRISEGTIARTQSQKNTSNDITEIKATVLDINQQQQNNNFCEGFFLTSFPNNNGRIIANSKNYVASCKHKVCSMLPAMEPEILYRYPFQDSKYLEVNNSTASICFPLGIKICYEQNTHPIAPKNYVTIITNQQGERYYMMTYHYYLKREFEEYNKEYSDHPLKYFLESFGESYYDILDISEEEKTTLEEELDICGELGFSEYVYIPFAFVLISKYPYIKQMESCLNSIMQILINSKDYNTVGNKIGRIVSFLINSVPIPNPNTKVVFNLPYEISQIEVEGPVYKDSFLSNINLDILLNLFSIENIIQIYRLILLEQKILFVSKEHDELTQITEAFLSLLFPIEWINTYIPIMSDKMTQYLQNYLPFVTGINQNLLSQALSVVSVLPEEDEGIYIVYIDNNKISYSKDREGEILAFNIPDLPKEIKDKLQKKLYEIKSIKTKPILNLCIRNSFVEAFAEMFKDFKDYLYLIDDIAVFDTKMLLDNRKEEDREFYKEITERQLFNAFIQNIYKNEEDYQYFSNILNNLKSNEENTCLNKFKYTTNQTEILYSYIQHNLVHSTYLIKLPFCENEKIKDVSQMVSLVQITRNSFGSSNRLHRILNEENRVITKPWTLTDKDYPSVIERYFIPGGEKSTVRKKPLIIFKKVEVIEKIIEKNKSQSIIERNKKEYELSPKQKEDIKEIIKDTLTSIFQSKVDINITPALQEIYRSFGRECFCKLVYQNTIKKIQPDCFNQLVKLFLNGLISMCNINENDSTLECAFQLTKSSFYYCKGNTGDFLYDELKMKLKDYFFWLKDSFWFKWLDAEVKEKHNSENKEHNYIKVIEQICDKMLKLQINKEYIIKFTNSLLDTHVSKNALFEEIKSNLNKQIGKCKYFEVNVIKESMQFNE